MWLKTTPEEHMSRVIAQGDLRPMADNDAAIGLYRRRGFERIAVRRRYYQPEDVDAWVMRLRPVGGAVAGPPNLAG